jgi:hypothetical protein
VQAVLHVNDVLASCKWCTMGRKLKPFVWQSKKRAPHLGVSAAPRIHCAMAYIFTAPFGRISHFVGEAIMRQARARSNPHCFHACLQVQHPDATQPVANCSCVAMCSDTTSPTPVPISLVVAPLVGWCSGRWRRGRLSRYQTLRQCQCCPHDER